MEQQADGLLTETSDDTLKERGTAWVRLWVSKEVPCGKLELRVACWEGGVPKGVLGEDSLIQCSLGLGNVLRTPGEREEPHLMRKHLGAV